MDACTCGRDAASETALPLYFLKKKTTDPAAPAIFANFHEKIGERRIVVKHEAAGCDDLTL